MSELQPPPVIQDLQPWHGVAVVRNKTQFAVFTTTAIAAGQPVLQIDGVVVAVPSRFSVQVARDQHIELPPSVSLEEAMDRHPWRFLNHSCAPNVCLRGHTMVAIRDLHAWEEVSFDYHTTEAELASPFRCSCGAPHCVGMVRGFRHLDPWRQQALRPWLADHLLADVSADRHG